jgi:hypothetical protein
MYDDQHVYTVKPGSLKNIQLNTEESSHQSQASSSDAQLE